MRLAGLAEAESEYRAALRAAEAKRAERDALVADFARAGVTYKDIAAVTGLSVALVGKIAAAAGVTRYRRRGTSATPGSGRPSAAAG